MNGLHYSTCDTDRTWSGCVSCVLYLSGGETFHSLIYISSIDGDLKKSTYVMLVIKEVFMLLG